MIRSLACSGAMYAARRLVLPELRAALDGREVRTWADLVELLRLLRGADLRADGLQAERDEALKAAEERLQELERERAERKREQRLLQPQREAQERLVAKLQHENANLKTALYGGGRAEG